MLTDASARIDGTVFSDLNGNGVRDPGDTGLADWTVFIDADDDGTLDANEQTALTDASGNYVIPDVLPGTHTIREVVEPAWTPISPPAGGGHVVTVVSGQSAVGWDFGNFQQFAITGQKYEDHDGDGQQQTGDQGLSGWTIFLDANNNGVRDDGETQTNASGQYEFADLGPGTYRVREVPQAGWQQTTAEPAAIVGSSGVDVSDVDFGNLPPGIVTGRVFHDANVNGAHDPCDSGVAGIVYADANNNSTLDDGEARIDTDPTGQYRLAVLPGTHVVRVTGTPADFTLTLPVGGFHTATVASGEEVQNRHFGLIPSGSISGQKFHDLNGDGVKDAGEPGLEGWTVFLDENANHRLDACEIRVQTNAAGSYTLVGVTAESHPVAELPQTGWLQTTPGIAFDFFSTIQTGSLNDIVLADFNRDGDVDLATANSHSTNGATISVRLNNGDGTFSVSTDYDDSADAVSLASGDLDSDGDVDLVAAVFDNASTVREEILLLKNQGDGTFVTWSSYAAGQGLAAVTVADLDGDRDLDLAVANAGSNDISVLLNNGAGTFGQAVNYGVGTGPQHLIAADLDADGDRDLAVANAESNNLSILRNQGDGTFPSSSTIDVGQIPVSLVAADLDWDGDFDLAVANRDSKTVSVLHNVGNASFVGAGAVNVASEPLRVTSGDLDNDDDIDLAVAVHVSEQEPEQLRILLNEGSGTFSLAANHETLIRSEELTNVRIGDLNRDGYLDLIAVGSDLLTQSNITGEQLVDVNLVDVPNINFGNQQRVLVSVPDYEATRGDTLSVAINVADATGLQSAEIVIAYDMEALEVSDGDLRVGDLATGWTLTPNISAATGTVSLGLLGTAPLSSGSGSLAMIDFRIADTAPRGTTVLDLVKVSLNEDGILAMSDDGVLNVLSDAPEVVDFQVTASGFEVQFSRNLDVSVLNLYDGIDAGADLPDVSLVGANSGAIRGSAVWDPGNRKLRFVKTGSPLDADTYTFTLFSRTDGFVGTNGKLLDGNGNGFQGGDYSNTFTVGESTARVLRLPDFARGPDQSVNVPATGSGLPAVISDGDGLTSFGFTVRYDPALLNIVSATLANDLPADWQLSSDFTIAGQATLSASGTTALPAGASDLVVLTANVPSNAPYGSAQAIRFDSLQLNSGAMPALADEAMHKVAYFGDVTGNRGFSGLDASNIARVAVGLDTGFDEFGLADSIILGDATANGSLSNLDASYVARKAVGLPQPEVPDLPGTLPPLVPGGPDPVVSIPQGTIAAPGSQATLPVEIRDGVGLRAADLIIAYDTSLVDVNDGDVKLGSLPQGWTLVTNIDDAGGEVILTLFNTTALTEGDGELLRVTYRNPPNATGKSNLDIEGQLNEGALEITPVDGDIAFWNPTLTVAVAAAAIAENAGSAATTATVPHSNTDTTGALTVTLTNGDDTEIGIPASVIIPAEASSVSFDIDAVDDDLLDGTQNVTITASAGGYVSGSDTLDVTDVEDEDGDGVDDTVEEAGPDNGDGNHDGTPDCQQDNVASFPNSVDDTYVTLAVPIGSTLSNVAATGNPSPDDAPDDATFPFGFLEYTVAELHGNSSATVTVFLHGNDPVNTYYNYGPTPNNPTDHWYPFMYDGETGAIIYADRIELHYVDGKRGDRDLVADGVIVDPGAPGVTDHPWRNAALPQDVNADGNVSSLDVLILIADINRDGPVVLPMFPEASRPIQPPYVDVVGENNALTTLDVLNVIAYINSQTSGEGEAVSPVAIINETHAPVVWLAASPPLSAPLEPDEVQQQPERRSTYEAYRSTKEDRLFPEDRQPANDPRILPSLPEDENPFRIDVGLTELESVLADIAQDIDNMWQYT